MEKSQNVGIKSAFTPYYYYYYFTFFIFFRKNIPTCSSCSSQIQEINLATNPISGKPKSKSRKTRNKTQNQEQTQNSAGEPRTVLHVLQKRR